MAYTVRYGRFEPDPKKIKWTVFDNVVADGIVVETGSRWFHLSNDVRVEVPTVGMVFSFDAERMKSIMSAQEGEKESVGE